MPDKYNHEKDNFEIKKPVIKADPNLVHESMLNQHIKKHDKDERKQKRRKSET